MALVALSDSIQDGEPGPRRTARNGRTAVHHLGILAHSVEGAALCLRRFAEYGACALGSYQHPDVTLDCIAMGRSMDAWKAGDYDAVRGILATSVLNLARAGADFFVCPDNTAHLALERSGPELGLPGLHIADVVADEAATSGFHSVGVLGTKWTMDSDLYPRALAQRGLQADVPVDADRDDINAIIFDELVNGVFTESSRARYVEVITELGERGCDAVALVCTEIPLLVSPADSPLPTLDSTALLARAACELAVRGDDLPSWRGGPIGGTAG